MDFIYIGDVVNTHGLKGELRIVSDFKYKNNVFIPKNKLYVGRKKEELVLKTYRKHKNYDMVTFEDLNDINDVICYKGDKVYINRNEIKFDGILNEDLIGFEIYGEDYIGILDSIIRNEVHEILVINSKNKKHMIPYVDEFINNIDLEEKRIYINCIDGLINED